MASYFWWLLSFAMWGYTLVLVAATARAVIAGPGYGFGNREELPEFPDWVARTQRAFENHQENLPIFIVTVFVAHFALKDANTITLYAGVYVIARVLHGLSYMAGIRYFRTFVFFVAWCALGMILKDIVSG